MDKCWFILRQTHYTAPQYEYGSMAFGKAEGPLRLGHLLPNPKAVDNIINTGGIIPFPMDMRITKSNTVNFRYSRRTEHMAEGNTDSGVPIAGAAGVTAHVEAGALFRRMMGDTWNIDRLETQTMQPTLAYIEQCRSTPEVATWIAKHKKLGAWKVYIITGLMIARGATNGRSESKMRGGHTGAGADAPGVINVNAGFKHSQTEETDVSGEHLDDFVWAIRLSRVSKGYLSHSVEAEPYTQGTVLAPMDAKVDMNAILAEEGLGGEQLHTPEVLELYSDKSQQLFFCYNR